MKLLGWLAWYVYLYLVVYPWQRHLGYDLQTMEQTRPIHGADYYACADPYCRIARPFDRFYLAHWDKWNSVMRKRRPTIVAPDAPPERR